jgi:hypothetical protein
LVIGRFLGRPSVVCPPGAVFGVGLPESRCLQGEHLGVAARERHQRFMAALLVHAAALEDDDVVGAADGGEAVGDEDGG